MSIEIQVFWRGIGTYTLLHCFFSFLLLFRRPSWTPLSVPPSTASVGEAPPRPPPPSSPGPLQLASLLSDNTLPFPPCHLPPHPPRLQRRTRRTWLPVFFASKALQRTTAEIESGMKAMSLLGAAWVEEMGPGTASSQQQHLQLHYGHGGEHRLATQVWVSLWSLFFIQIVLNEIRRFYPYFYEKMSTFFEILANLGFSRPLYKKFWSTILNPLFPIDCESQEDAHRTKLF